MHEKIRTINIFMLPIVILILLLLCASGNKQKNQEAETLRTREEGLYEEFIVTLTTSGNGQILYGIFTDHVIVSIEEITDTVFIVRLEKETSLSELNSYTENELIQALQPNFSYSVDSDARKPSLRDE